jgi:hypothetical protein
LQAAPPALPAQSPRIRHATHVLWVLSQNGPPLNGPQSESLTQATHSAVFTSQTVPTAIFWQSALVAHLGMQMPLLGSHASVFEQSVFDEQPHCLAIALHALPLVLPAQSAFVAHPTHKPVPVSQTPPEKLPAQSVFVAQALMQLSSRPGGGTGPPTVGHV